MPKGIPKNRTAPAGDGAPQGSQHKRGRPKGKSIAAAAATTKTPNPQQLFRTGYHELCRERDQLTQDLSQAGPKQQRLEWLNRCIPMAAEIAGIQQPEKAMTAGSSISG